jgi:hypothetical protein
LPGTELAFDRPIDANSCLDRYQTAIFRQVNQAVPHMHHDALELPNGKIVMLTSLAEGQAATVLQLPAASKTNAEEEQQDRVVLAS